MTSLKKARIASVMKYTWPLYIISLVITVVFLDFIFGVVHRTPTYKTLTLFLSGKVENSKKLKSDLLERFKDNDLKSVTLISAKVDDVDYYSKLSVPGYNSADILIIPVSKLETLNVSAFGLELENELITSFYQDMTLYQQDDINYGVKLDKEKVKEYLLPPEEDCYMILNGKSQNIGVYGPKQIKEHDNALNLVKDWGM
jgi:hypothetical protein